MAKVKKKPAAKSSIGKGIKEKGKALRNSRFRILIGICIMLIALYACFAMVGFFFSGAIDQSAIEKGVRQLFGTPAANNIAGNFGAWIADVMMNGSFGVASFILCYLLFIIGLRIAGRKIVRFKRKIIIGIVATVWLSVFTCYVFEIVSDLIGIKGSFWYPGGAHGFFLNQWLNGIVGKVGTLFILIFVFFIILFFGFEKLFNKCINGLKNLFTPKPKPMKPAVAADASVENPVADFNVEQDVPNNEENVTDDTDDDLPWVTDFDEPKEILSYTTDKAANATDDDMQEDDMELTVNKITSEESVKKNLQPLEDYDPTLELSNYTYPSLDLLVEHSSGTPKVTQEELDENKNRIVDTLKNYKIEITKIKATIGPTVTLYEIVPAPGVKISKIKSLEDDIALSLSALGIRIIAPIPGAGTIGIEVPNQTPEIVSMRSILASKKFQESKYALPVAMGRTIANETYTFDLTKMPHLLVAGATGQGKSVGLNAIITSLLYKKHPSQLKFVMVDPKKVELSIYSTIEKHFLAKLPDEDDAIITETSKVINTLNSLCVEMDARYDLLKDAQVRNIKEYNEKFVKRRLNPTKGHKYLPYIVVVVDEFADLIMTAGKEVEQPIARIAQLARAVGIHMIIATQRPSANIITGIIKANFPARMAFKVASMIDSRTILDASGANQLIGRGDMLISVGSEMTRVQCAFVDTPEIEAITEFIAKQQSYPSAFALPEYHSENEGGNASDADLGPRDPLFEEAARLVVNSQQGSTSSIQRRFSIGYNRAGRIMDQLEKAGIVGPFEGSKPRQVYVHDEYSLEKILRDNL
ncbi:MAG: DNA translocase FtsK [Culturomica sp.]|jgi:S-DNA-T family DNA segregation ATPase FtsK/SpoIIIE|nr:DNA translocase FtsK [Culturomica sp.]